MRLLIQNNLVVKLVYFAGFVGFVGVVVEILGFSVFRFSEIEFLLLRPESSLIDRRLEKLSPQSMKFFDHSLAATSQPSAPNFTP